jgi:hypothetical protein
MGTIFTLFSFVKGHIAADYLQYKYLYKAIYYSVQFKDVFFKVFFGCEVALTEYLKVILGEYFYWSDYYGSHDSETYERWYSFYGLSAHRVGMELKINNHLKGLLYFCISEHFYANEGMNFQFVYTF